MYIYIYRAHHLEIFQTGRTPPRNEILRDQIRQRVPKDLDPLGFCGVALSGQGHFH